MFNALFNETVMLAKAKLIVEKSKTNQQAAKDDFEQLARDMSADERADFEQAIVRFAIESGS